MHLRAISFFLCITMEMTQVITSPDEEDATTEMANVTRFDLEGNSSQNCTNDYCYTDEEYLDLIESYLYPNKYEWVLIGLHSVVFLVGLIGNALVCVAVYRNHTMRTVTNYFIVNLAVADFMVILFCLPPTVLWDVTGTWFFGKILCKIVVYVQNVSVSVSVLTLTFISIDRWYAICYPLRFNSTTGRAKMAIMIIWFLALVFDIPELIVLTTMPSLKNEELIYFIQCDVSWSADSDSTWTVLKMVLLYVFPLAFMSVAYFQIVRVLWHSDNLQAHADFGSGMGRGSNRRTNTFTMNSNASTEGQLRSRRKAAKMLVSVVVMFAVCYLPVHVFSVLRLTMHIPQTDFYSALALIFHWMCYANSAINPVIYNFMSGKFRREFRRAFSQCCHPSDGNRTNYQFNQPTANSRDLNHVYAADKATQRI